MHDSSTEPATFRLPAGVLPIKKRHRQFAWSINFKWINICSNIDLFGASFILDKLRIVLRSTNREFLIKIRVDYQSRLMSANKLKPETCKLSVTLMSSWCILSTSTIVRAAGVWRPEVLVSWTFFLQHKHLPCEKKIFRTNDKYFWKLTDRDSNWKPYARRADAITQYPRSFL